MKWLKKWYYLILFLGVGAAYLTFVDGWQVYAGAAAKAQGWYEALREEKEDKKDGTGEEDIPVPEQTAEPVLPDQGSLAPTQQPDVKTPDEGNADPGGESGQQGSAGEDNNTGSDTPVDPGDREITYRTVEDDYFSDALFIGDSRTVGMHDYGGLEEITTFYASKGLTVYKMFSSEIVSVPGQKKKITVEEALENNSFAKIYLMIGINEMGTGTVDTFMKKYEEVVTHLRELQPDAIIYLQAIMKVTAERSEKCEYNVTNEGIEERNERIAQLADNEKIFYLDVNPLVCDETGGMIEDYTFDGVHLKGKHIEIWKQFLKEHVVDLEE